jgi:hypothetical protein
MTDVSSAYDVDANKVSAAELNKVHSGDIWGWLCRKARHPIGLLG